MLTCPCPQEREGTGIAKPRRQRLLPLMRMGSSEGDRIGRHENERSNLKTRRRDRSFRACRTCHQRSPEPGGSVRAPRIVDGKAQVPVLASARCWQIAHGLEMLAAALRSEPDHCELPKKE